MLVIDVFGAKDKDIKYSKTGLDYAVVEVMFL
jgi:hypothetical protein